MTQARILLVEREPAQAKKLVEGILHFGLYPLGPAFTLPDALTLCLHGWPDLAIVGIDSANVNISLEIAERLGQLRNLPMVFLHEHNSSIAILERMPQIQPFVILHKHYQAKELQKIIQQGLALATSSDLVLTPE